MEGASAVSLGTSRPRPHSLCPSSPPSPTPPSPRPHRSESSRGIIPLVFFYTYGAVQFVVERVAFNRIKGYRIQGWTPPPTTAA